MIQLYLKTTHNKKTGRSYLSIVRGYRDAQTSKPKSITVKSIGYLDELEKEYNDPIEYFKEVAKNMTKDYNSENEAITINFLRNEILEENTNNRKNLGYAAILKIYHELELDKFFINKQRHKEFEYDTNAMMILLVISRLLNPCSKKKTYNEKDKYFERFDFTIKDIYRGLTYISKISNETQKYMHEKITIKYGRDTSLIYYDITNYYFEIDKQDNLRRKGVSKEHRPDPIVQMGLAIDRNGIPISYKIFSGNKSEKLMLRPMISEIKKEYKLGRIIIVADKGLNSGDNIYYTTTDKDKDGYVFSQTVRGSNKEFKDYVLEEKGYRNKEGKAASGEDEFKIKSRIYPREIEVTTVTGKKAKRKIDEKQVVFYNKKYDKKAKAERNEVIEKAIALISNPSNYKRATTYGASKYILNLEFDKKTGEIITTDKALKLDLEKLKEEEKYDGYYCIVTSELKETDEKITEIYRGLWKIEESFRVTKSDLESRPVYLSKEDHINAHFLTCFISLVISRILQMKTGYEYSVSELMNSLNKISCTNEQENIYLFDFRNEVTDAIGKALGIDFTKKRMQLSQIKKILSQVKKR